MEADVPAIAGEPFGEVVAEPVVGAAAGQLMEQEITARAPLLVDIAQQPETEELPVNGHESAGMVVLNLAWWAAVHIEHPDSRFLADVLQVELADLLLPHAREERDQWQPE